MAPTSMGSGECEDSLHRGLKVVKSLFQGEHFNLIHLFRHFCCRMYIIMHNVTQTDRQMTVSFQQPILLHAVQWLLKSRY